MRIEYGSDGSWTTIRDGQVIDKSNLNPTPGASDWVSSVSLVSAHTRARMPICSSLLRSCADSASKYVPPKKKKTFPLHSKATLVKFYTTKGAVIYSSIWSGWEPDSDCGPNDPGALPTSGYTVSNLRINGTVVQGMIVYFRKHAHARTIPGTKKAFSLGFFLWSFLLCPATPLTPSLSLAPPLRLL